MKTTTKEETDRLVALTKEAIEVANETGKTPRQLADRNEVLTKAYRRINEKRKKLAEANKELVEVLRLVTPLIEEYRFNVGHDPSAGINSSDLIDSIERAKQAIKNNS